MSALQNVKYKTVVYCIAVILGFACLSCMYFSPIFDGKVLQQHDVMQYQGMAHESLQYEEETGHAPLWTNALFGGMPTYLIHQKTKNMVAPIYRFFHTTEAHPEMIALMYLVWMFLALLLVDMPLGISFLGALFYGLSTYFYIIIEAGHITKCVALGYMPLVILSLYAIYWRKKHVLGAAVFTLALALQLVANHLQITYYTALICAVLVAFALYEKIKAKTFMAEFFKPSLLILCGILLAIGANFSRLYSVFDYTQDSMRGKSELTDTQDNKTGGLDKDYATAWSYGIDETIDLLVPNFMGGASMGSLDEDSQVYTTLKSNGVPNAKRIIQSMPTYWGEQPITSGPVYIGAIVIFLFVFGLFYVQGSIKWWLAILSLLSVLLAWGHNFMPLTDLFLDYFPGYNKFRTVSMILIIAEFTMPVLGIFALYQFFNDEKKASAFRYLSIALGVVGGFLLLLAFTSSLWSFQGPHDAEMLPDWLLPALQADRKAMMMSDIWRSLLLILATYAVLAVYRFGSMKQNLVIAIIAALVIIDMVPVNKRFMNNEDFVLASKAGIKPTKADKMILQDTDLDYRVMNLTVSPFNDASTSYFHKSVGGYHGAKMKRYQELIDSCLSKNNMAVYNMLNTRYFIVEGSDGQPTAQRNPGALGNAWFVQNVHIVPNADAEIAALKQFNPASEAFVDARFAIADTVPVVDSSASIVLTSYEPESLSYTSHNAHAGVAIFSEIYYAKGWNAYIDGQLVPHFRANYVLRGLEIPAGDHTIDFKFEPRSYVIADTISLIFSTILLLAFIAICGREMWKSYKARPEHA